MLELFDEARQALFRYDIPRASQYLVEIFDALIEVEQHLDVGQQEKFQALLQQTNMALQNQDYLLTADLLEYEIRPLISKVYQ